MDEARTLEELLSNWRGRNLALTRMMGKDYGAESPERNKIISIMNLQLTQCIEELEAILAGNPMRDMLVNALVKNYKEIRESESK